MSVSECVIFGIVFILIFDNYRMRYQFDREINKARSENMRFHYRLFCHSSNVLFETGILSETECAYNGELKDLIDEIFYEVIPEARDEQV